MTLAQRLAAMLVPLMILAGSCSAGNGGGCGTDVEVHGAELVLSRRCDGVPLARFPGVIHSQQGEVDGSPGDELVILWAPDARSEGPRIWVVRLSDAGITYLWRGSRMSGRVDAFVTVDAEEEGPDCLVTRETANNGESAYLSYRWSGFGFGHGSKAVDGRVLCGGRGWTCGPSEKPGRLVCNPER